MTRRRLVLAGCGLAAAVFTLACMLVGLRVAGPYGRDYNLGSLHLEVSPSFSGKAQVYVPLAGWQIEAPVFSAPYALQIEPRHVSPAAIKRAAKGFRETLKKTKRELKWAAIWTFVRAFLFALLGGLVAGIGLALLLRALQRSWRTAVYAGAACLALAVLLIGGSGLWVWQSLDIKAFKHPTITRGHGRALTVAQNQLRHDTTAKGFIQDLSRLIARGKRIKITVRSS